MSLHYLYMAYSVALKQLAAGLKSQNWLVSFKPVNNRLEKRSFREEHFVASDKSMLLVVLFQQLKQVNMKANKESLFLVFVARMYILKEKSYIFEIFFSFL